MASNVRPRLFQCRAMAGMSSVRSRNVYPVNPPVCVESTAVGITLVSMPAAERIGSATVREHFPKHEMSWTARTLFCLFAMIRTPFAPCMKKGPAVLPGPFDRRAETV